MFKYTRLYTFFNLEIFHENQIRKKSNKKGSIPYFGLFPFFQSSPNTWMHAQSMNSWIGYYTRFEFL